MQRYRDRENRKARGKEVGHGKGSGPGETEWLVERNRARGNRKAKGKEVGMGKEVGQAKRKS